MEKNKRVTRQLRDRKVRKFYTDDWPQGADDDDEIDGPQAFDLDEKIKSEKFNKSHLVKQIRGTDFNLAWVQQNGLTQPLLFKDKTGLGIRVPGPNFTVSDVKICVGSKRLLDVMDVKTQKNMEMTMKQWQEYYDNPNKDRLLNVISLEFSHTKLENLLESPTVVRQLDWVDRVWPRHLKNMQTESTNVMDEMMYPKVQKYCLMSIAGCYTDFHVDFGGTSVWYHIHKGAKIFWLIPPTDKNLDLYQSWVLSGKQSEFFFGDNVLECGRVYLEAGDTFFIPSGWIHAVYTPKDSLVFGGNFLHSFGIEKQLKIAMVEEATKVPQKFRYPFFTEMLWYTLERYVHCLIGTSFIRIPLENGEIKEELMPKEEIFIKKNPSELVLSPQELLGLKAIVLYLHQLPLIRKNVPALIYDPVALLRSVRTIVEEHRYDDPYKAVTGRPILVWAGENADDVGKIKPTEKRKYTRAPKSVANSLESNQQPGKLANSESNSNESSNQNQQRRVRCSVCQSCTTNEDCKSCSNCISNLRLKESNNEIKSCLMRECLNPMLPINAVCYECGKDGWDGMTPANLKLNLKRESSLMECFKCNKISHPICLSMKTTSKGYLNEDLPNSWECPFCFDKSIPVRPNAKRKSVEERRTSLLQNTTTTTTTTDIPAVSLNGINPSTNSDLNNGNANKLPISPIIGKKKDNNLLGIKALENEKIKELPKSVRDDEKIVQEKLAQVVRRKSVEDMKAKSPAKATPKAKTPKLTPKTTKSSTKKSLENSVKSSENSLENTPKKINSSMQNNETEKPTSSKKLQLAKKEQNTPIKRELSPEICSFNSRIATRRSSTLSEEKTGSTGPPSKKIKVETPAKEEKKEEEENDSDEEDNKSENEKEKVVQSPAKNPYRTDLSQRIMNGTNKVLKKPTNIVRPAIPLVKDEMVLIYKKKKFDLQEFLKSQYMVGVFSWLDLKSLNRCLSVSKDWNRIAMSSSLWLKIDLTHRKITAELLKGTVRRQPSIIKFDWTTISKQQLLWLIQRLPQLRDLSLRGVSWNSVQALKNCLCPNLAGLDLSYVGGLTDSSLREILAPPVDSRPGLSDSKSRLRQLKHLSIAGACLSDVSLRYITQHAGSITRLNLSCCSRVTDAGIAQLGAPDSPSLENLAYLNISGCPQLTNICLDHLKRCKNLEFLDIRKIQQITYPGLTKFLSQVSAVAGNSLANTNTNNKQPTKKLIVKSDFSSIPVHFIRNTIQNQASSSNMVMTPSSTLP